MKQVRVNFAGGKPARRVDEAGLTPQRRVVLEVIRESDTHPTANDVFAGARVKLESISYATVYNSLHYLCEAGLVREITFGNGASRYDRITTRHDHALCELCGKLVDFDLTETPELMRKAARRVHFKPASIHLTLFGLCPECQRDDASPA